MDEMIKNKEQLDEIFIGRVEPYIYAFSTNTIPNYLKVGDAYRRPVEVRLQDWKKHYPELEKEYSEEAKVNHDIYFRDYSVHYYLTNDLGKKRLGKSDVDVNTYYSREFFKDTSIDDVKNAVKDIKDNFEKGTGKYQYYNVADSFPAEDDYPSTGTWVLRDNQKEVVNNFNRAVSDGRTDLLMYAVMRFGKTFTSLMCAKEMNANFVLIVSGKAEVKEEWKKTCRSADNFKDYTFYCSKALQGNYNLISESRAKGKKIIIFLTLQDLQGGIIKEKHKEIFKEQIDLLIVDETHFAARAPVYGYILRKDKSTSKYKYEIYKGPKAYNKEENTIQEMEGQLKKLQAKITLHLSGTPYRILMDNEFQQEDIICHCQFADIVDAQEKWDIENFAKKEEEQEEEWRNPYYGFPQMIRFAFNPSKSALKKLNEFKNNGKIYSFSALLEPKSKKKDKKNLYKKFVNENEVLELFQAIDGSKEDENVFGFLNYDRIKEGCMCRHIVCVLPFCASCDALEELILANKDKFKNLNEYKILNISSVENRKEFDSVKKIQNIIHDCENRDQKTLTLTVNRMLTGTTVEEWDTMIYLKDTSSPQEYDQAIYRLQSQYLKKIPIDDGSDDFIIQDMKPQTLLVDFDPHRVFTLQEQKAQIENIIDDKGGNSNAQEKIKRELEISPLITINKSKIERVTANNIMDYISQYSKDRSVMEETLDIPVDDNLMDDDFISETISRQAEIGSSGGLRVANVKGEGESEFEMPEEKEPSKHKDNLNSEKGDERPQDSNEEIIKDERKTFENKFRTYYARILFYSFLVEENVTSLDDIIYTMSREENVTLAKHLDIDSEFLKIIHDKMNKFYLSQLDYKIKNINTLANDESLDPLTRVHNALASFNRLSESEVVTPQKICGDMVKAIPEEELKIICENHGKILDIAGKVGEFATAIYEKFTDKNGLNQGHDTVKDLIYTIPTSKIAYEFTKKIYNILGLNTEHISSLTSYDLLNLNIDVFFKQEGENMKFDFIIGNPPYQDETLGDNKGYAPPIYHKFLESAYQISDHVELIHPARFLFNAGSTPKEWNKKMLSDPHFTVLKYEPDSSEVFYNTEIKGGVAISYRDANKDFGAIQVYTPYDELKSIIPKVAPDTTERSLSSIMFNQTKFNLNALYQKHPEYKYIIGSNGADKRFRNNIFDKVSLFTPTRVNNDDISVIGVINNKRVLRYFPKEFVDVNHENLWKWKVLVARVNGAGILGEVLSNPIVSAPNEGYTQTFIGIGSFDTKEEADNTLKYVKTKFLRLMLGTLKITQDNSIETWRMIPLQDFTSNSDIDWAKSIPEIDRQLYSKYGLNDDEISFIESNVKEMD